MKKTAAGRLLALAILAGLPATVSHATTPSAHRPVATHASPELKTAAKAAVEQGLQAELPPHISTLLGLTREEKCAVRQGVLRSSEKIEGFEVTEKNHDDIVIFVVDETTHDQTFYLTSPSGALRKVLSVKEGVGQVVKPTQADLEAFQGEKRMWKERLAK